MNIKHKTHHALEAIDSESAREIEDNLWWVQGRKTIITEHLHEISRDRKKPDLIMDIGCGSGGNLEILAKFGKVIGVEPSQVLADRSRARCVAEKIYEMPAWQVPDTASTDLFTMFDVLEHIEDDAAFLKKIKSNAPTQHRLLVSVPACPYLFGEHDRLLSHYRRYSKKSLQDCFEQAGYKPLSLRYHLFFAFPIAFTLRLVDKFKSHIGVHRKNINLGITPPFVNALLMKALSIESSLSRHIPLPVGLWLFAIAEPV